MTCGENFAVGGRNRWGLPGHSSSAHAHLARTERETLEGGHEGVIARRVSAAIPVAAVRRRRAMRLLTTAAEVDRSKLRGPFAVMLL